MGVWGRVLIALVVPVAWGLVTAWFFDWLRQRQKRNATGAAINPATDACSENEVSAEHPR